MAKTSVLRQVFALTLALCLDACLVYAIVVAPLERTHATCSRLASTWAFALLRCLALTAATAAALGGLPPAPARLLVAHSALPAVLETGTAALRLDDNQCGVMADAHCWLMCAGASLAASLFWEVVVPDSGGDKEKRNKPRVLFMRVVRLYKPDYPVMLPGFLFLTLAVVCQMSVQFYTGKIIDNLRGHDLPSEFFSALLLMGLCSLGSSVGTGCRGGLFTWARSSFTCRVNGKLFEALTKQEVAFFETVKTGEITSRLSQDTSLMGDTACLNVNVLLRSLIKMVATMVLMLQLSWQLTFLVLMEVPVTGVIQNIYNTHEQRLKLAIQDSVAVASDAANEIISGIRTVRSFSAEKHEACHYDNRLLDTHALKTRRDTVRIVYLLVRRLTELATQVLMLWYGRLFIQRGQMSTGDLVSFILYQSDLGDNIRALIYISCNMLNSVAAAAKVFEYLDREPRVSTEGELAPDQLQGHVVFRHLNFVYPTRPDVPVLQDFSLELKAGQMTALVGPSGEGKSTCASLLKRWYEPLDGEILLDGEPLGSYDHRFLSKKIALVSQEPVLFSGTVRRNIAYGLDDCSMDAVRDAARQADAHNFITQLEKGYDTDVGEGGSLLSKSERQRIAIARALVRRPQVLIVDEITSSLDEHSENKVLHALASRPNQTLLVIAHRLKTIEKARQIAVIGGGKVQERGTHRELLDKKGSYCKVREKLATAGSY
ncbi:antigen peptide transporter 2-like isoform X1 [Dunckerocampus dactyliophorus]|uniref:antigen peptide transporter 2-like isoform X1 n=1 Tax=Dunckerocampus dactyliophorus TaxID=161453 RepID=UPI00240521D0|nr:antigen peptide transporter 2-like isoform X1 [Dunckerocampus dactyliophorus]